MLEVKIIQSQEELEQTTPIPVALELWGTQNLPKTWAYMGYVPEEGFYVEMYCEERNPARKYRQNQDPVCLDSAMELFLWISSAGDSYLNFEMNANGAIRTEYGPERHGRGFFSDEQIASLQRHAQMEEDSWNISFKVPNELMEFVYGKIKLEKGSRFSLNFFKAYEGGEPCQYGAYGEMPIENPSFHEPHLFTEAVLV